MFRIKAVFLLGVLVSISEAAFTDFEDLALRTGYVLGETFTSNGISFEVVPFPSSVSFIGVRADGGANGSGKELYLGNSIGVNLVNAVDAQEVSLRYGESCCDSGVEINGALTTPAGGLIALDGMTIGGVAIEVTSSGALNDQGILTATGNITSFIIGGTEFYLDDVGVNVLLGDYDDNGLVGSGDLSLVLANWDVDASVMGVPDGWINERPTKIIGFTQLDRVLQNWGNTAVPPPVPEPSSVALMCMGCVTFLRRWT